MPQATEEAVEKQPRLYELLYIVPNSFTEDEVPKIAETVNGLIEQTGGKITKKVNYGKRRLAYPVKQNHYGYYLLNHYEMDEKSNKELYAKLRVQDEVLRYLITNAIPESAFGEGAGDLRQAETPAPKKEAEKPSRKKPSIADAEATAEEKKKMARGTSFDLEKELGVTAEEAQKALEEEGKDKSKRDESVDMKGLESKLDEIMKDLE